MPPRNDDALRFLETRRSVPPKLLRDPAPEGAALQRLLTIALRVPDHGKLEPWRLIVLDRAALGRLAPPLEAAMRARGDDEAAIAKARAALASPLIVAVVSSPVASDRIPAREQLLSAANVAFALTAAALADGWGAAWLTGPLAEDRLARDHLGLAAGESVVALVHIGSDADASVSDRPRPNLADKVNFA